MIYNYGKSGFGSCTYCNEMITEDHRGYIAVRGKYGEFICDDCIDEEYKQMSLFNEDCELKDFEYY